MDRIYEEFLKLLEEHDRERCVGRVLQELQQGNIEIVRLYTEVLKPALNGIDKEFPIWKEHIRSSIIRSIIECCYPMVLRQRDEKGVKNIHGRVVTLCPDGEYHELGARMGTDFFTLWGFDAIYVGSSTPKEELYDLITHLNPRYITLSVTNYYNLVSANHTITAIRQLGFKGKILVGGNAFLKDAEVYKRIGADALIHTFEDIEKLI